MWFKSIRDKHIFGKVKTKAKCPIIAVTACRSEEVVENAKLSGMEVVLSKPVDVVVLKRVLN